MFFPAWKVFQYGVFSGLDTGKQKAEKSRVGHFSRRVFV